MSFSNGGRLDVLQEVKDREWSDYHGTPVPVEDRIPHRVSFPITNLLTF